MASATRRIGDLLQRCKLGFHIAHCLARGDSFNAAQS